MQIENLSDVKKQSVVIESDYYLLSIKELNEGTLVFRAYSLNYFGALARKSLESGIFRNNQFYSDRKLIDGWLIEEFLIPSPSIKSFIDLGYQLPKYATQVIDDLHIVLKEASKERSLLIGNLASECFVDIDTGQSYLLPMHRFKIGDRTSASSLHDELPENFLQDCAPDVLQNPQLCSEKASYLYSLAVQFGNIVLGEKNQCFYKKFESEKLLIQHKKSISDFKARLDSVISNLYRDSFFMSSMGQRNSDFHYLRNEFLQAMNRLENKKSDVDLLYRLSSTYYFGNIRSQLNEIVEFKVNNIENRVGGLLVVKGQTGSGKNILIDELISTIKSNNLYVLSLHEETREYESELNPMYEVLHKLISRLTKVVLSQEEENRVLFNEKFQTYFPYLVTLNSEAVLLDPELEKENLEKGAGSLSDRELLVLARDILSFLTSTGLYVLIRIDADFKVGMSRARSNTSDISDLCRSLPVGIIGSYNEEGSEYNLGYRLADVQVKLTKLLPIQKLNTEDIKRYLDILGMTDSKKSELVSNKLVQLSKGKMGTLRELIIYSIGNSYIEIKENGDLNWNIEDLSSKFLGEDSDRIGLEILKKLSVEEGTMLKRLALVKSGLPSLVIAEGLEHYGKTGLLNLEKLGLIQSREFSINKEESYVLPNSLVRSEILSNLDRRERIFLSIQLARSIGQSSARDQLVEQEADLWTKTIDYVVGDNDRERALDSLVRLGKRYFRISDFKHAKKYISLGEKLFSDMETHNQELKLELYNVLAAIEFRLGNVDESIRIYSVLTEEADGLAKRVSLRNEMIEQFMLMGKLEEAIKFTKENFKELDFDANSFVNSFDVFRYFFKVFFGIGAKRHLVKEKNIDIDQKHRLELIIETIMKSISAYYIVDQKKFLSLMVATKKLCDQLGTTTFLPITYLSNAVISLNAFKNQKVAKRYFDVASDLAKEMGNSLVRSRVKSIKGILMDTMVLPDSELDRVFGEHSKESFIARDEQIHVYVEMVRIITMILSGRKNFERIQKELQSFQYQCITSNRGSALRSIQCVSWFLSFSLGELTDDQRREQLKYEGVLRAHKDSMGGFVFHLLMGIQYCFERNYFQANKHLSRCLSKEFISFSGPFEHFILFYNLICLSKVKTTANIGLKIKYTFLEYELLKKFNSIYKMNPSKFLAKKLYLTQAARGLGNKQRSFENLEEALYLLEESKDGLSAMIVAENLASCLVERKQHFRASKYLEQALTFSEKLGFQWFSDALVQGFSVGESFPVNNELSENMLPSNYQWSSIIKLVQEVGGESSSIKSLGRVLEFICSVTNSERGLFLIPKENGKEWELKSLFDKGEVELDLTKNNSTNLDDLCSMEVVNYSFELGRNLILDNAHQDSSFMDDLYVQEYSIKSIFCMPILVSSKPVGIVYIENNTLPNVYRGIGIEVPSLLASLGFSILEKAELYNNLEKKVVERTSSLDKAQKELTESAYQAGMAEVATETIHNLGNLLNSLSLESEDIVDKARELLDGRIVSFREILTKKRNGEKLSFSDEEFIEYSIELADYLVKEMEGMESLGDKAISRIGMIKNSIQSQQEFSKSSGFEEEVYFNDLISQVIEVLKPAAVKKRISVSVDVGEGLYVLAVRSKIAQVLLNILKNAYDAFDGSSQESPKVSIRVFISGDSEVYLEISDNGIGIDEENQKRIFEYGFTTKDNGHGFGLHSVAMMAEDMGGSIKINSAGIGKGSTFTLIFKSKT